MPADRLPIDTLPDFDMADYLDSDEAVAQYLALVLAEGDAGELAAALEHVARAGRQGTAKR